MGFMQGKKVLVTGMLSSRSIAYGIAKAMRREGAQLAFTYQGDAVKDRVLGLAGEFDTDAIFSCDVTSDQQIDSLFSQLGERWDGLDGIVHSIAFAPREALAGDYLDTVSREAFRIAHDISSYSFAALAKAGLPLMQGRQAALLTLSYLGAERAMPNYNVMGLAKASLEANVRYMAFSLGPEGHPRQRHLRRADQDPGRGRHRQLRKDPVVQREGGAAAAQRDHRGGRQHRGVSVQRSGERHHRRDSVRGRGVQYRCRSIFLE